MSKVMTKLTKDRAQLTLNLSKLTEDLRVAPVERRLGVAQEIGKNQAELFHINEEIKAVDIAELNAQFMSPAYIKPEREVQ